MLDSQRLKIEELRLLNKSNQEKYLEMREDHKDYEILKGEHRAIVGELAIVRDKLGAAHEKEGIEGSIAMARHVDMPAEMWTPELKEFRELGKKVSLNEYILAAVEGRPVQGAAAEYNQQVFNRNAAGDFPIETLLDRNEELKMGADYYKEIKEVEHRAAITGLDVNMGASVNFLMRLFANSESVYMNARMIPVSSGDHSFPIVSGSTVAADYAEGASETAGGEVSVVTAIPRRIQYSYELSGESEARVPGVAQYLISDLRAALMAGLDKYVLGKLAAGLTITPAVSTTVETLPNFLSRWGAVVDGKGARNVGDVKALVNTRPTSGASDGVFDRLSGLSLSGGGSHFWELPRLTDPNYLRGSDHIPAVGNDWESKGFGTGDGAVLFAKTGADVRRLMVPIWRRGSLMRDTGRRQLQGEATYTAAMYAAAVVGGTDMHRLGSVHTA